MVKKSSNAEDTHDNVESLGDSAIRLIDELGNVLAAAHRSNVDFLRGQIRVATDLLVGLDEDARRGRRRIDDAADTNERDSRRRRVASSGAETISDFAHRLGDAVGQYADVLQDCSKTFQSVLAEEPTETKTTTRRKAASHSTSSSST